MLEYFVTNLMVFLLLLTVPTYCCKRKKTVSKKKHKKQRKGKKEVKHSTTPTTTTPNLPLTPLTPQTPQMPTPVMTQTPKIATTATNGSTDSAESLNNKKEVVIPIGSNKSKENVDKTEEEKKSDKEQEDLGELLRCRDYTPENFAELKWLFDLLD
ncbi:hypothetical protein L5515_002716 [Caenorhabditis briggsae]|uniref:Uncharacterized protein n=1 Tax=Caenorhabditis briggsae TaxID=6238 RepID=A0AAE9E770_CAEBR|nr:hypothetical protein L5515_002716 [Caenorhabditis briggsae]